MTTLAQHHPSLDNFFSRLRALDAKLANASGRRQLLPAWWKSSLKESPSAVQQAIIGMSRALNLELKSVLDPSQELRLKDFNCQYKKSKNTSDDELAVATSIIHSAATTAVMAMKVDFVPLPAASEIRNKILSADNPWIDFESLVEICWKHGIPVLHMPTLPVSKKMDAVVVDVDGRPAIALTKNQSQSSWLLFHLAHEIGHIACGHLQPGETLIDEKINESEEGADEQESEADAYALELLTGSADRCYYSRGRMTANNLAMQARKIGREQQVSPGHIVLNWAFEMAKGKSPKQAGPTWGVAGAALNALYPAPNWKELLHQKIEDNLDDEEVTESDIDYLFKLTGMDG